MADKENYIERIREHAKNTFIYKSAEIFYTLFIITLLGGVAITSTTLESGVVSGNINIQNEMLLPVIGLMLFAITFYSMYIQVVTLIADSLLGELVTFFIGLTFWLMCVYSIWKPHYWPFFGSACLFLIPIKNACIWLRLKRQKEILGWRNKHPLEGAFGTWFLVSFGYAVFAVIISIVAYILLELTNIPAKGYVINFVLDLLIFFFCVINLGHFYWKGELQKLEAKVNEFFEAEKKPFI